MGGPSDFSTEVECVEGKSIAVDRTMTWTGKGAPCQEGSCSIGTTSPSTTWYLPEGSSAWNFETWTLVENPNDAEANVTLTYMTGDAMQKVVQKKIPAYSRASYDMAAQVGACDSSVEVTSDIHVIAEGSSYRNNRREGDCSIGATTPSNDYFLGEGSTAWGFRTFILVQNPGNDAANVTLTYMTPTGPKDQPAFTMPPLSRKTVNVNDVAGMANTDLSTQIHSDKPIVASRSMYWNGGPDLGEACHSSIGLSSPHMSFYLPDGQASGGSSANNGWETYTLVANPNQKAVKVQVTYLPAGGGKAITLTDEIAAGSRKTYNMLGGGKPNPGISGRASTVVKSLDEGVPIIVERSMYWNNRGAGTNTIGAFED
jgi:hypothetical protein